MAISQWLFAFGACAGMAACGKVMAASPDTRLDADPHAAIDAARATSDAAPDGRPLVTSFTKDGAWANCPVPVDCEDVYDFDFAESAVVTAKLSNVAGGAAPRLALFAGTLTVGADLFNGSTGVVCGNQDADLAAGPLSIAAGHYELAVGRDWGNSQNTAGTYTVTVAATMPFAVDGQTGDDLPSNQGDCP